MSDGETWAQVAFFVIVFTVIIVGIYVSRGGGGDEATPEAPPFDAMPKDREARL